MVAVRWYLRYGLSYRDVEELLAERGIAVDHVTVYRWVQRFTPLLLDAARPCRHAPGIDGSLTKRIPRLPGGGSTFTLRSTSSGRSLTYWARAIVKTCGWGLLDESLGESFGVECPDDPIAVRPDVPQIVALETVRVGVASQIQPGSCPAFAVLR